MMLGIQSLMKINKNEESFWDFSHLGVEELEDIVGKFFTIYVF